MIEFFSPNLEHFSSLPTFHTNCPHVSHFAQMGSHFAQNTTTNPCSELSSNKPLSGICMYTKHPQPHPKTPLFLAWTWKWAKWTTVWANWTPTGQNVWKVRKTFREVGKKKNYSLVLKIRGNQTKSVQWQFGSGRQHLSLLLSETEDRHKQAAQSLVKQLTALVR